MYCVQNLQLTVVILVRLVQLEYKQQRTAVQEELSKKCANFRLLPTEYVSKAQ